MYKNLIGKDISDFRKYLGYWWLLTSQFVNNSIGIYYFSRSCFRDIEVRTENNVITDIRSV